MNTFFIILFYFPFQVMQTSTIHDVKQKFHKACKSHLYFKIYISLIFIKFIQISDLSVRISSIL